MWLRSGIYVSGVLLTLGICTSCGGGVALQNSVASILQPVITPSAGPSIADANTTMIVADIGGHRVLIMRGPFSAGQTPAVVIGQPDLVSMSAGRSATQLRDPNNAILDAAGNLWVSDTGNNRVLEFVPPFTNGMSATLVLGQPDFTSDTFNLSGPKTSVGLANPEGIRFDKSGNLWVADSYDSRVVEFTPPFQNGMAFTLEMEDLPQAGPGICSQSLCTPSDLTFDSAGNLWVVDANNNRVLRYSAPLVNEQAPDLVIGQSNFTSTSWGRTASTFSLPWGIAFDSSGNLWITDAINLRVLRFSPPFSNGEAANLVLGEKDFTSFDNGDSNFAVSNGRGIAFDANGNLYAVDSWFQRVMIFTPPFANGMPAAVEFTPGPSGFGGPTGPVGIFIAH